MHNATVHIALGLSDHLDEFVTRVRRRLRTATVERFPFVSLTDPTDDLWTGTTRAMRAAGTIYFNLAGVSADDFARWVSQGHHRTIPRGLRPYRVTNRELYEVLTTPALLRKAKFYAANGERVPPPVDWVGDADD